MNVLDLEIWQLFKEGAKSSTNTYYFKERILSDIENMNVGIFYNLKILKDCLKTHLFILCNRYKHLVTPTYYVYSAFSIKISHNGCYINEFLQKNL